MTTLITLRDIHLSWGTTPLLDHVGLTLARGERVALLGRNGSGKSTLLKIIGGELQADSGEVARARGVTVARLEQEVPGDTDGSVAEVVAAGLGEAGRALADYTRLSRLDSGDEETLARLSEAQSRMEASGGWLLAQRVGEVLSRLSLDGTAQFAGLSGGMKRRILLAQALVQQPDVLLLDEPTNHLDLEAIAWLEDFLLNTPMTLVFITHDRALVRAVATRIVELDRGRLTSYPGSYAQYLQTRQAQLEAEERAQALFDKKLSQEEQWIRRGIEARRTRNEGRVRALKAMREEHAQRRRVPGQARLAISAAERSGKLVLEAEDVAFGYGDKPIVRGFSTTVLRGDRIGIIGPNGCGKSTLLRVLLGELAPLQGKVTHGTRLQVAYFDQLREALDLSASVRNNVAEGADWISLNGQSRHVMGYLQDFLFDPERANQPVSALSGGERNRLLLARLFTREFNLLVLDEPTNDLDAETLELLEDQLMQYSGTLIVVSHDREFLDNVVTRTMVFEHGELNEYVGGYQDWVRQRPPPPAVAREPVGESRKPAKLDPVSPPKKKLGYSQQRELLELPERIAALEQKVAALQAQLSDPALYKGDPQAVTRTTTELAEANEALERAFARWEELEG